MLVRYSAEDGAAPKKSDNAHRRRGGGGCQITCSVGTDAGPKSSTDPIPPGGGMRAAKERVNIELNRLESRWLELKVRSMLRLMLPSSSPSSGTPDTWVESPPPGSPPC